MDDEPSSLPGYETVNSDPNYEELQPSPCGEPDYASLSRHYHQPVLPPGFTETNYEPTYETARYPPSIYEPASLIDPNYESVGSSDEPPYERVRESEIFTNLKTDNPNHAHNTWKQFIYLGLRAVTVSLGSVHKLSTCCRPVLLRLTDL